MILFVCRKSSVRWAAENRNWLNTQINRVCFSLWILLLLLSFQNSSVMEDFWFSRGIFILIKIRFPIIESEFRPFRYSVLADSIANKGILYAKIKAKDSTIIVFNTHTQASYFGSSSYIWVFYFFNFQRIFLFKRESTKSMSYVIRRLFLRVIWM